MRFCTSQSNRRPAGLAALSMLLVLLWPAVSLAASGNSANDEAVLDLTAISLEELMDIEVTSVSRKDQRLSRTATAVYALTTEDIRRLGATSVPEALRMVPGIQVARIDSSKWAVSARGFNGRFSNKMLVLVDGRSIYKNLYSGVYWDQQAVLLEDIERIEVIRGPGATMWGANAVNGVINIITKPAEDTQGFMATALTGNVDRLSGAVRYGGSVGDKLQYRGSFQYQRQGPMALPGGELAPDRLKLNHGGFRVDWQMSDRDTLMVAGGGHGGDSRGNTYTEFPLIFTGAVLLDEVDIRGGYALGRWDRRISEKSQIALQGFVDRGLRTEHLGRADLRVSDIDFQHRYRASERHDLMWGAGFRQLSDDLSLMKNIRFDPASQRDSVYSAFVQDDIQLQGEELVLTLGSKFQHNSYTGFEVQPSVRIFRAIGGRQGVWGAVSRAVRTPIRYNRDLRAEFDVPMSPVATVGRLFGQTGIAAEELIAFEAGYRRQIGTRFSLDATAFYNRYDDLITASQGTPEMESFPRPVLVLPMKFHNGAAGRAYGVEVATATRLTDSWKLFANYSWYRPELGRTLASENPLGFTDPDDMYENKLNAGHMAHARTNVDLTTNLTFDAAAYYVSRLPMGVPAYLRLDSRFGWSIRDELERSVVLQNLLDTRHLEFLPEDYSQALEIRRAAYVKLTWTF